MISEAHIAQLSAAFGRQEARGLAQWISEEPEGFYDPDEVVRRLLTGEPVQYIFGHTDWRGLRLQLNHDTLIPRPETSDLVDAILAAFPANQTLRVLDIGTGSGCIAIALKQKCPLWQVEACDISEQALAAAASNAEHNLPNGSIRFFRCDILSDKPEGEYDLVVSNPPYIMEEEKISMESNVLNHEPHRALFVPDADPCLFYRRIASLHPAPALAFEINERLGYETAAAVAAEGYSFTQIQHDLCGKERILMARN